MSPAFDGGNLISRTVTQERKIGINALVGISYIVTQMSNGESIKENTM